MRRSVAGIFALLIAASTASACVSGLTGPTPTQGASPSPMPSSSAQASPASSPSRPDIPAGLPVMAGAMPADPPAKGGVIASWLVDAIGPDVYQHYLGALPAAGFDVTGEFPGGNVAVIRFTSGDGQTFELAMIGADEGDRTRIDLRLPDEP